jgi:hypothetical protein
MEGRRVFSEGVVDGQGWQLPGGADAAVPTTPDGTAALLRGIENNLYGLHELPGRGHRLALLAPELVDGVEHVVLRQIYPDGGEIMRLLNPASWLVERSREVKALHPDIDPTKTTVETRYSDFREVGGIVRPFEEETVDLETGEVLQAMTIKRLAVNPVADPAHFLRP